MVYYLFVVIIYKAVDLCRESTSKQGMKGGIKNTAVKAMWNEVAVKA